MSPLRQIDVAVFTADDPEDELYRHLRDLSGRFEFVTFPDAPGSVDRIIRRHRYEMIVLDARRSLSGVESIIRKICTASPASTVVMLVEDTDLVADATGERFMESGVTTFVEPEDLADVRTIRRLMAGTTGFARRISEFARYRRMVDHTQDVITLLGPDGRIEFESPSIREVLGYDPDELIGRDPFELVHEEDRPNVRRAYLDERENAGTVRSVEYRFRHADGSWRILESRAKVFRSNGNTSIIVSSRDVSDRHRTLEALRDRERKLAEAQRLTHIGSWQWKIETNELTWSDELYRIYGFEPGSPLSFDRYIESVHPRDRELVRQTIADAMERAKPFSFTHRIIRPDGEIRVLEGRGEVRVSDDNRVMEMYGTGHDITELHESRSAIEESERRFRSLFESSPDAILVFAADGTVRDSNPAAAEFFGADRAWLSGRTFIELLPPDERDEAAHQQFERLLAGEDTRLTLELVLRDGDRHPVEIHANSIRLEDENAVLLYMRDIAERLETERTLRRLGRRQEAVLERERERISREVHDVLGQALTAIKMDVAWVASHLDDERTPGRLEDAGQRIDETIETVRRIAHELRPGMLDDFGLAAAIEWHAKQFSQRTGLEVHVALADSPDLDRNLATTVFRVFQELLTNVARHAEASSVEVSLTAPGENLVVSVRDDGIGMDLEDVTDSGSLGITGVRERLSPWGGRLDLASRPGDGLRADVIVPLRITAGEPAP